MTEFLTKIPESILSRIRNGLSNQLDKNLDLSIQIIGSWSRGEGNSISIGSNILPVSDIEVYYIGNEANPIIQSIIKAAVLDELPIFDVDVSGTTWDNFQKFRPRLWLYDASCFNIPLMVSSSHLRPFAKYHKCPPNFSEILHLVLNHQMTHIQYPHETHNRIKIWNALGALILKQLDLYESSILDRKDLWENPKIKRRILKLDAIKKKPDIYDLVLFYFNCKLHKQKFFFRAYQFKKEELFIPEVIRQAILFEQPEVSKESSPSVAYQIWLNKNISIYREWLRSFIRLPKETFLNSHQKLPPRFHVYFELLNQTPNQPMPSETFPNWERFCKSA